MALDDDTDNFNIDVVVEDLEAGHLSPEECEPDLSKESFQQNLNAQKDLVEIIDPKFLKIYDVFRNERFYPKLRLAKIKRVRFEDGSETIESTVDISRLTDPKEEHCSMPGLLWKKKMLQLRRESCFMAIPGRARRILQGELP